MDQVLSATSFIVIYGLSYGVVLFTISVGLVVTMGLMRVVNLAHGAFAAIGGYVAVKLMSETGVSFPLSIAIAIAITAAISVVIERLCYVQLYTAGELDQVLMTTGLLFLAVAALNLFFGPNALSIKLPEFLAVGVNLFGRNVQAYRLFVIACGLVLMLALWWILDRTSFGARLRAAVDNRGMAEATGIDVAKLFSVAFALGSGLAAFGGAVGFAILPLEPMYPFKYLTLVLMVVTLSGFGNIKASAISSVLVGLIDTAGRYLFPAFGAFTVYFIVIGILMWRDRRLFLGWVSR
jgi:branched-chain amino acid transport system permease protein